MKILVFGSSGLVGSRFVELYNNKQELFTPLYTEVDITNYEAVSQFIIQKKPTHILNFAAYTDTNKAEDERGNKQGLCFRLNVDAVKNIQDGAKLIDAHFTHISTDMVFPGDENNKGPYNEQTVPEANPEKLTWYGYTKGQGEKHVDLKKSALVRIIYPVRAHYTIKEDYFHKILSMYKSNKMYPLFNDQQITITYIDELFFVLQKILQNTETGIHHVCSSDTTTPYDISLYLLQSLYGNTVTIPQGSVDNMKNPRRYPKFGGLQCLETQKKLNMKFKTTHEIVDELIKQGIL